MVSGIDDQLRRQWTRPGQTLRARVNLRARDPPEVTHETSSQPIAESCENSNIIVRIMNLRHCRFSAKTIRSLCVCGNLMPHAIQIRQTGGPEVLNWTRIKVGEPGSGQVRLRQAAGL